jgi:ferredoxin--NADP+ reductase
MPDAINSRITDAIRNDSFEQLAGITLNADDSHVMMCGNSAMITEVSGLLEARGMRKHLRREPGHITTEKYH